MVHVRFNGRSLDIPLEKLNISAYAEDRKIRRAVARCLEVEADRLEGYAVDRPDSGDLIVRPEAVYG